jgi:Tat protein translocase TatB subunit
MSSALSWQKSLKGIDMDKILGIGMNELLIIFVLATIVLGPERLVRVAREAGKLIRNLKSYTSSFYDELKSELDVLDDIKKVKDDLKK